MARMQNELKILGYKGTDREFRDLLKGSLTKRHPEWSDERLTFNPKHAMAYCSPIRDTVGLEFSDEFVLSTLYKIRKTGWGSN